MRDWGGLSPNTLSSHGVERKPHSVSPLPLSSWIPCWYVAKMLAVCIWFQAAPAPKFHLLVTHQFLNKSFSVVPIQITREVNLIGPAWVGTLSWITELWPTGRVSWHQHFAQPCRWAGRADPRRVRAGRQLW